MEEVDIDVTKKKETQGRVTIADLPRVNASGFVSVYANNAGSASSVYDLRLIFGQIMFGYEEEPRVENSVSVTMAWEHVPPLRDLLTRLIEQYEAKYGKIRHIALAVESDAAQPDQDKK